MEENNSSVWSKIVKFGFDAADIVVSVFAIVAFVCTFLIMKFDVSGSSMQNTLQDGDKLLVWHFMYEPQRGDIVTIKDPGYLNKNIIKRVIAKGGDKFKIDLAAGKVWVNDELVDEKYIKDPGKTFGFYTDGSNWDYPEVIPKDMYFCMGDNRLGSSDSRSNVIGLIRKEDIMGGVMFRYGPINSFRIFKVLFWSF